jgi:hypothetical protein
MPIRYQVFGTVAVITIDRPEAMNALDAEHNEALAAAFDTYEGNDRVQVAVLTGAGNKAFSAGARSPQADPAVPGRRAGRRLTALGAGGRHRSGRRQAEDSSGQRSCPRRGLGGNTRRRASDADPGGGAGGWRGTGGFRRCPAVRAGAGGVRPPDLADQGAQRRIDLTIKDALDTGSDYCQIATACGVSRQAIRQRWLRRTAGSRWFEAWRPARRPGDQTGGRPRAGEAAQTVLVRLAGGPYDGARAVPFAGEILEYEADSPPSESSGPICRSETRGQLKR